MPTADYIEVRQLGDVYKEFTEYLTKKYKYCKLKRVRRKDLTYFRKVYLII